MGIYTLPLKNMRRNKIRNFSTILRIAGGVILLLILISSGLGINSFVKQAESFGETTLSPNASQTNSSSNQTQILTSVVTYLNSTFGIDLESSPIGNSLKNLLGTLIYVLDGLASIALFIGVLGVLTTMYFNEIERRREVGLFKIMGFSEGQIFLSLTLEGALLGLIAAIIGVILGYIGVFLISSVFTFISLNIVFPPWLILGVILVTTFLSFILAIYPAWLASKNDLSVVFR
ncbi:MAG TPA: FtsX-like permease family protein [Methanobacterium sp.]